MNSLIKAIREEDLTAIDNILSVMEATGLDVNFFYKDSSEDLRGFGTPLYYAIIQANIPIIQKLLDKGAEDWIVYLEYYPEYRPDTSAADINITSFNFRLHGSLEILGTYTKREKENKDYTYKLVNENNREPIRQLIIEHHEKQFKSSRSDQESP